MSATKTITDRLEHLERENRKLRRGFWILLLGAVAVFSISGAVQNDGGDVQFGTIEARRIAITDRDGDERLVLQLDAGEPTLTMRNHDGMQQVYLGIDENWNDSAYLSVNSRLENGSIDTQALLVANTARQAASGLIEKPLPGNSQLVLCDLSPAQDATSGRHLVRLSSGRLDDRKPYFEISELKRGREETLSFEMLTAEPDDTGRRFLLDSTPERVTLSDVEISEP